MHYVRTPVYTVHICIHAYCLSYVQLYVHILLNSYTQSIWHIHRCLPLPVTDFQFSVAKNFISISLFFHHPDNIFCGYQFHLHFPPRPKLQVKANIKQIQPCKCIPLCHILYLPFIFACRHVSRISQVKKIVLAILCRDSGNSRSSGCALGLRVHQSVRYNYEKLIPGRPVWHCMYNVSYGDLMHSSLTVQRHTFEYTDMYTHIFSTQTFSHAHIPGPYVW